jgi:DNA polymerase I-like protein with 3'-5' exonuclease and polymerase domains
MKLALVYPSRTGESATTKRYVERVVNAAAEAVGATVDMKEFYSTSLMIQRPPISAVRQEATRLLDELDGWADTVVTLGGMPLNSLARASRVVALKGEHGRMRWLDLPSGRRIPWTPTIEPFRVVSSQDLHRDFAAVITKAVARGTLGPLPPMDIDLHVCDTVEALSEAGALLDGASVVGLDVETTGLSAHRDGLLAVGFGAIYDEEHGIAVVASRDLLMVPEVDGVLWDLAWRASRRSVGHNLKFDMQFLRPFIGWPPEGALLGDTLLLHHLLDERPNRPTNRARGSGLKDLVAQRFDYQYGFDFDGGVPEEELPAMYKYLGDDVCYTARLWHDLNVEAAIEGSRVLEAHERLLMPVSRAIARCESAGAPVDLEWVKEEIARLDSENTEHEAHLHASLPPIALTVEVTNLGSAAQIGQVIYDEWNAPVDLVKRHHGSNEDRSTDEDHVKAIILWLRGLGDELSVARADWLEELMRYRKAVKLRITYQKSLVDRVDDDGRVRPSFLLHGAATGRISARDPAIQTIPAVDDKVKTLDGATWYKLRDLSWTRDPMRKCFAAGPGRVIVEVDYSQLELRVAAGLSHDKAFTDVFVQGHDIHREVAAAIFSKAGPDVTKPERYLAKAVSFGIIYGRSAKALAEGAEMDYAVQHGLARWTPDVAEAFISKFRRSYPELEQWSQERAKVALSDGYVESWYGRRRRFPFYTKSDINSIARQAVNTPIQAQASDICLNAMVAIQRMVEVNELDAIVLFPVHDSIVIECDEHAIEDLKAICLAIMEVPFEGVPLKVDFEWGRTWADTSEDGKEPRDATPDEEDEIRGAAPAISNLDVQRHGRTGGNTRSGYKPYQAKDQS